MSPSKPKPQDLNQIPSRIQESAELYRRGQSALARENLDLTGMRIQLEIAFSLQRSAENLEKIVELLRLIAEVQNASAGKPAARKNRAAKSKGS